VLGSFAYLEDRKKRGERAIVRLMRVNQFRCYDQLSEEVLSQHTDSLFQLMAGFTTGAVTGSILGFFWPITLVGVPIYWCMGKSVWASFAHLLEASMAAAKLPPTDST
jgi:hypothetical protein